MTHRAWTLIVIGYAILALGAIGVTIRLSNDQDKLEKHQDAFAIEQAQIERNQKAIRRTQATLLNLTRNTAAAICLIALADEPREVRLVHQFNRTHKIDVRTSPDCVKAIETAIKLVVIYP